MCSGVTGGQGAACPPETSDREISADLSGKNEARRKTEKGVKWRRKGKLEKGRWKIEMEIEMEEGKSSKMIRVTFFFLLFTFQNDENLFWVYQNGNFLLGKSISRRKKIWKNDFAPSGKIPVTPLLL